MVLELIQLTALVAGIMMVFKQVVPNRLMGIVSVLVGVVISLGLFHVGQELGESIVFGLIAGLTATGAYDAVAIGGFNKIVNKLGKR